MTPEEILEIRNIVDRAAAAIVYCEKKASPGQKHLLAAAREGFDVLKRQRDLRYTEYEREDRCWNAEQDL